MTPPLESSSTPATPSAPAIPDTSSIAATGETLLTGLDAASVADAIRAAGCAVTPVERDGIVHLQSASHGVGFQVLWGNRLSAGSYADLTLSCAMRLHSGDLPEGLLNDWHRAKRFARAAQHGEFVALELDIVAAGGISPTHLRLMVQLWMQMMGEFFLHLRHYASREANHPATHPARHQADHQAAHPVAHETAHGAAHESDRTALPPDRLSPSPAPA